MVPAGPEHPLLKALWLTQGPKGENEGGLGCSEDSRAESLSPVKGRLLWSGEGQGEGVLVAFCEHPRVPPLPGHQVSSQAQD